MSRHIITAYVPILLPDDGPTGDYDIFYSSVDELESLSKKLCLLTDNGISVPLEISICRKVKDIPKYVDVEKSSGFSPRRLVNFKIAVSNASGLGSRLNFEKRLFDILCIMNLAKPGWFAFAEGYVETVDVNSETKSAISGTPLWFSHIHFSVAHSRKLGWPALENVPIKHIWEWFFDHARSIDGISQSKVGHALNAYSYLFHESLLGFNPEDLFWALLGIEAVYAEGALGIQSQVDKKTQLVLGKRKEHKKIFGKMYSFRSRFIHGDLDFANREVRNLMDEPVSKYLNEMGRAKDIAITILIATLQKMAVNRWDELNFNLKFKNNETVAE